MPFQYQDTRSPAAGSIAELMLRRGDIAARRAEQIGNAQAGAAQASGNAWAGAAQNIGQSVSGALQQATDPKRQSEALALKEQKTGIAEHDAFKKILKNTPPVNENGMQLYNLAALASKATAEGIDPSGYLEHYANVNNGFRNEYQARMATVQAGAQGLMLAPDATLAKDFLDRLVANNTITSQVHEHLSSLIDADPSPANITRIASPFAGPQKPMMGKPGETPLNPITAQPMGASLPDKPVVVPQGGTLVTPPPTGAPGAPPSAGANVVFTSPPAPTTAGNEAAIRALYAKRESGQELTPQETAAIKGYEAEKSSNDAPVTVKTMVDGKAVERVMTRTQALAAGQFPSQPSASVTIHNDNAKTGAVTSANNAEQLVAGNMPPSMLSRRAADYNATLAEANKINKERTGKPINLGQLQIDYESAKKFAATMNSSQMVRYRGLADSVVNTIDEVNRLADELQQGGVQKWSAVKRSTIQQVYGNTPQSELAAQYVGAVNTLKEEFANLAQGGFAPNESAWGLANEQINKDFGFKDMRASLTEVQRLINFRTHAIGNQTPYVSGGGAPTTTQPTGRYNPATGKVEPIK